MPYNGHKNWNHWNVSLWLFNNEYLYRMMCAYVNHPGSTLDIAAARILFDIKRSCRATPEHPATTPDGAPYTFSSIRAAIAGWER